MPGLLSRPLVPVANEDDAIATYERLLPYVDADSRVRVVKVIEKAGGGIDKASVAQREEVAEDAFSAFSRRADADGIPVETEILYGTDVAETIIADAGDSNATAIAFTSRGGSKWIDILSGGVRSSLIADSDLPVVVLPAEE